MSDMREQLQIVGEMVRMVWRRAFLFGLIAICGMAASLFYALSQVSLYETTAAIQIQRPQVSGDLARSTADTSVAERVQRIEQRLLARDNIEEVINDLGLFADQPGLTLSNKVGIVRNALRIERIAAPGTGYGANSTPSALLITVTLDNAKLAADTANRFVESLLEQNVQSRGDTARRTLLFFEEEETRISNEIIELEREIANFKNSNIDALPEGLSARRDEIGRIQTSELDLENRILELEQQQEDLASGEGRLSDTSSRSPEYEELRRLEVLLAERSRVLAPTHPEIRQLELQIAAVVAGSSQLRESAVARQVALLGRQVKALNEQIAVLAKRRAEIENSVRNMPKVTMELNALNRRLQQLQDQYSVINVRRAEAETGLRLEDTRQSERFVVLENALVPDTSISGSRKKTALLGGVASIILAFGLVWLLEMINPVMRCPSQMKRRLDLRPVVAIPYIATPWERMRKRLVYVGSIAGILLAAPFVLEAVNEYVMPLEEIAEKAGLDDLMEPEAALPSADLATETEG